MSKHSGYTGKISNSGLQHVKAPFPAGKGGGKTVIKSGSDLRTGGK